MHPALAPARLIRWREAGGALNALFVGGRADRPHLHPGPGAAGRFGLIAAAVAADIADIMTGAVRPVFQAPADQL